MVTNTEDSNQYQLHTFALVVSELKNRILLFKRALWVISNYNARIKIITVNIYMNLASIKCIHTVIECSFLLDAEVLTSI
jgi:hypothetical protein